MMNESVKSGLLILPKTNPNPKKWSDPYEVYRKEFRRHIQEGTLRQNIDLLKDWRECLSFRQLSEEFDDKELNDFLNDYNFDNQQNINFVAWIFTQIKTTGKKFMQIDTQYNNDKDFTPKVSLDSRLKYRHMASIGFETKNEMEIFVTTFKWQFLGNYNIEVTGILANETA